jgi:hypothetical protein
MIFFFVMLSGNAEIWDNYEVKDKINPETTNVVKKYLIGGSYN